MIEVNLNKVLRGPAFEISIQDDEYPKAFLDLEDPPQKLYLIGNPNALKPGLAIVGARRATPYGLSCAKHFASIAAKQNIVIISGGAFGCDSASHKAALHESKQSVAFLGGGCNEVYPPGNESLFQQIIDKNGAVVSEHDWNYPPIPHTFLKRNRLIAALSKATLIVEAGLPSGTFSTADFAASINREVFSIPGPITNDNSMGCNKLIYEGAKPIINDEVFLQELLVLFPSVQSSAVKMATKDLYSKRHKVGNSGNAILDALRSQPLSMDELYEIAKVRCGKEDANVWLSKKLVEAESSGMIAKYPNGNYGPKLKS